MDYNHGGHSKYDLKVHLIFVTKYRKKILQNILRDDVKQFLYEATYKIDCQIIQMETDKDHVHILLSYSPYRNISEIVKYLKQYSTYPMWKFHYAILKRQYWKRKVLWSDGYFACSIGQVSQKNDRNIHTKSRVT